MQIPIYKKTFLGKAKINHFQHRIENCFETTQVQLRFDLELSVTHLGLFIFDFEVFYEL